MIQPEFPEELRYIWDWYLDIHTRERLTYTEIKSWADLTRVYIEPREVELLRILDSTYWQVMTSE